MMSQNHLKNLGRVRLFDRAEQRRHEFVIRGIHVRMTVEQQLNHRQLVSCRGPWPAVWSRWNPFR